MTVLIVDDSPAIISRIAELLEDVKTITDLKSCGTYYHAIELLNCYGPQIVLLDINLPDKSGIELLRYIKASLSKTIVVMVTNHCSDYYRALCIKIGADYFVDKSRHFERLPSLLSSFT